MSSPTFRPTPAAGSGSGDMTKAVYDTDDDGKVDSAKTLDGFDSADFASRTASDLTLYVYEDATGDGDGSSKTNGFTTLQAAIDAIPDVAQNVTIIVCKGSTNYLGDTTTIHKASVKLLIIQGEYYWYANCDANAVAGKVVDADIDTTGMEVGDRVVCTKYSGTVGASSIEDYFYATITEVGSGYVQTSEETKVPTTGWRYLINQTVFDGNNGSTSIIKNKGINGRFNIQCYGVFFTGCIYEYGAVLNASHVNYCIFHSCKNSVLIAYGYTANIGANAFINILTNGYAINGFWYGDFYCGSNVFGTSANNVSGVVCSNIGSSIVCRYSGFFNLNTAIKTHGPSSAFEANACHIASTCTYGAYGYNITLVDCTNNAATPVYNLTGGGSIEEWGGEPLPSIADATGGQVLALKSDKSALEFATVDLDTLGAASSTTANMTVYVDSAATGAGDGTSWTDAFTTIQAAIDSLPLIIAHTVVILVRDGTYNENLIVSRQCLPTGSIEIRAEYYWYGTVAATKNGKITLGASDFGYAERVQIEAGDRVIVFKWSGTNGASVPTTTYEDTVASVSGAEVTLTTNSGVSFTSACTYAIIKNSISASSGTGISIQSTGTISITGFKLAGSTAMGVMVSESVVNLIINCCDINGFSLRGVYATMPGITIRRSRIYSSSASASGICASGPLTIISTSNGVRIYLTGTGSDGCYGITGTISPVWSHIAAAAVGLRAVYGGIFRSSAMSYCLNEGTIPRSPASSSDPAYIS